MTDNAAKSALVVRRGWAGHQPIELTDLFIPLLITNGYTVHVEPSPRPYADAGYMRNVDLIVQRDTMATINSEELQGLRAAIEAGTGIAGWPGGIADSYRNSSDYLHLIGGQFACHPGKHPDERIGAQSDNYVPYRTLATPEFESLPVSASYENASRGFGLEDLANTPAGREPRPGGNVALHVLEVMESLLVSAHEGTAQSPARHGRRAARA